MLTATPIAVACQHAAFQCLCGGDGEDAGAGADVEDHARPLALQQIVEREKATARACVMSGAEGLPRVDLDGEALLRHAAPVVAAMHQEAPGAHRAALLLRQRHPIRGRDRLDAQRSEIGGIHVGLD